MYICVYKGVKLWIPKFSAASVTIWPTSLRSSLKRLPPTATLSDEFGVEIPDEDIENFHTVGDVVNYLEERI